MLRLFIVGVALISIIKMIMIDGDRCSMMSDELILRSFLEVVALAACWYELVRYVPTYSYSYVVVY